MGINKDGIKENDCAFLEQLASEFHAKKKP